MTDNTQLTSATLPPALIQSSAQSIIDAIAAMENSLAEPFTLRNLPAVVTPSGGGGKPGAAKLIDFYAPDGATIQVERLPVIPIALFRNRTMWPSSTITPGTRPVCTSQDGVTGISSDGWDLPSSNIHLAAGAERKCSTCPFSKFKSRALINSSASSSSAPACSLKANLVAWVPGYSTLFRISLSPTALISWDTMARNAALFSTPTSPGGIVGSRIVTITAIAKATPVAHSVFEFHLGETLTPEQREYVKPLTLLANTLYQNLLENYKAFQDIDDEPPFVV